MGAGGFAESTPIVAAAVPPAPLCAEETAPVELLIDPADVTMTVTEKLHDADAARLPFVSEILPLPGVAVTVPPQEPLSPFDAATDMPAGSWSVKPTAVRETRLGLVRLKLSVAVEPAVTLDGEKVLLKVGAAG
jgi:hypothetical protein